MKSSSFLCGLLLGAVTAVWASRRKNGIMSMMGGAGSLLNMSGEGQTGAKSGSHSSHKSSSSDSGNNGAAATAQVSPSPVSSSHANHSKEYDLKQITDFIKGNPSVRREVEAILKETNAVIPGLS